MIITNRLICQLMLDSLQLFEKPVIGRFPCGFSNQPGKIFTDKEDDRADYRHITYLAPKSGN